MEVLVRYGFARDPQALAGAVAAREIRSAFAMTEPRVASSDATNIQARIEKQATST